MSLSEGHRSMLEDAGLLEHPDLVEDEVLAAEIAGRLADLAPTADPELDGARALAALAGETDVVSEAEERAAYLMDLGACCVECVPVDEAGL